MALGLPTSKRRFNSSLLTSVNILFRFQSCIRFHRLRRFPTNLKLLLFRIHLGLQRRLRTLTDKVNYVLGYVGVITIPTAPHLVQSIWRLIVILRLIRHRRFKGFNILSGCGIIIIDGAISLVKSSTVAGTFYVSITIILRFIIVLRRLLVVEIAFSGRLYLFQRSLMQFATDFTVLFQNRLSLMLETTKIPLFMIISQSIFRLFLQSQLLSLFIFVD